MGRNLMKIIDYTSKGKGWWVIIRCECGERLRRRLSTPVAKCKCGRQVPISMLRDELEVREVAQQTGSRW
jgi:hypothetical protein